MLEDIESLNRKIFQSATDLYELKVQKQEAELAYLRSQVDPHFLYNTLEVIRKMALEKDAPEIAQMTLDMGHIFRYSAKGEDEVTLEEEISIIKSYSRIQQMRFEGKISVYYFVSEDVLELKVMKMLLQHTEEQLPNMFNTAPTSTMQRSWEQLQTMEKQLYTNIIYGKESIDAFDKFVEDWKAQGGDQITQEVNEWYQSVK